MGEYEPHDSRNVTLRQDRAPGEPPRTGPMEELTRQAPEQEQAGSTELDEDGRGEDAEQTVDTQAEQELREEAIERDAEELGGDDRND